MNLYLIDGNSYVYRAFYAIRDLATSKGLPTNAVFGFTNMLLKIRREKSPEGLAIFFDSPLPTKRHMIFEEYKSQRPETPPELVEQIPHIRKIISAFDIKIFEVPGYEADDIIGTIAKKIAGKGVPVFIVSADKDMFQLLDENIKMYDPVKDRLFDAEYVTEKFGVGPERVTEFMALTGDAIDNIPGIKGVGEKTAKELLSIFSDIPELFEHSERIKREKLRKLVIENKDTVLMSQRLATIDTDVPVEIDVHEFTVGEPDWTSLLTLFKEFEFSSLMKLVPSIETIPRTYEAVTSRQRLSEIVSTMEHEFALDVEATGTDPLSDTLVGIALCNEKERSCYIPVAHADTLEGSDRQIEKRYVIEALGQLLRHEDVNIIGHNLKYDLMILDQEGVAVQGTLFDTMIAAYLLNPNKPNNSLDEVSFAYLSKRKKSFMEVLKKRRSFAEVSIEEAVPYASEDAALSFELKEILFRKLEENGLSAVYHDIEMPLIPVLIDIEKAGLKIDVNHLGKLSKKTASELDGIQKRIYFLAGEEFNINSPKQLGRVLFQRLGLKPSKKTKTGYSTGMDVLEELAEEHELPREVLYYRSLTKLKTTYLDTLPELIHVRTGRVHTSFNQAVTSTGRLSSRDPNLQNIPIRGELGARIREAFIAEDGNILLSADYSQVELRVLAHLSRDEGLIDAFTRELDVHTRTASELYSVPLDKVTPEMRRTAKTVNFGIIYGISAFGLSETLNIERKDAEKYISQYFERHPGVRHFTEKVLTEARQTGCVATLMGRKRPIPEIRSQNRNTRQQGERFALNSPIQGTAADIIKIAMIHIWRRFKKESLRARMILQVHDELLFELPEYELAPVKRIVKEEMEGAVQLSVPLRVEIGCGNNWAEAH